jgi:sulfur relay (sulfurtransferase) DsrF/TusC family protein
MKVLQIVETAYRATLEEQDDPIIWISHAMKGAGADLDVLLRGNAVNYAVAAQDASGLSFGDWQQSQPPDLAGDIAALADKDVNVFVVQDDLDERGLRYTALVEGIETLSRARLPALLNDYDQIWNW